MTVNEASFPGLENSDSGSRENFHFTGVHPKVTLSLKYHLALHRWFENFENSVTVSGEES